MASKVIPLKSIQLVDHSVEGDHVILKFVGRYNGKETRVEIELCHYALGDVIDHMRAGTNSKVKAWTDTQKRLNQP